LSKLDGTGGVFADNLLQRLAPQRDKSAAAVGAVQVFVGSKGGVFAAEIAEFNAAAGNAGV